MGRWNEDVVRDEGRRRGGKGGREAGEWFGKARRREIEASNLKREGRSGDKEIAMGSK